VGLGGGGVAGVGRLETILIQRGLLLYIHRLQSCADTLFNHMGEIEMAKQPSNIVALINEGIASLKDSKQGIANDIRKMQNSRRKYHHILKHIVTPEQGRISVNRSSIYVTYRGLSGFKDLRLDTTLCGLVNIGKATGTQDYASLLNRDYMFEVSFDDGTLISVIISAYVSEDSKTCRKIKVGEEYKTVDKFEIVCD
jgi:hypothetical protein